MFSGQHLGRALVGLGAQHRRSRARRRRRSGPGRPATIVDQLVERRSTRATVGAGPVRVISLPRTCTSTWGTGARRRAAARRGGPRPRPSTRRQGRRRCAADVGMGLGVSHRGTSLRGRTDLEHPRCRSAGRPGQRTSSDDVQVGVEDALLGRLAGVGDDAVTRHPRRRRPARPAPRRPPARPRDPRPARRGRGRAPGHHQHVGGRGRIDVAERQGVLALRETSAGISPATMRQNRHSRSRSCTESRPGVNRTADLGVNTA